MAPDGSARYLNRELSWIEFNARVLHEARRQDAPLLERLKFLSIFSSNYDEFFMVRVASVKHQIGTGNEIQCPSGVRPSDLLERILSRTVELEKAKEELLVNQVLPELSRQGLALRKINELDSAQRTLVTNRFLNEVFPVLTPVRAPVGSDLPYIANLRLHVAFVLQPQQESQLLTADASDGSTQYLAVVQIPASLDRVIYLPDQSGIVSFVLLEDVIIANAEHLFPGYTINDRCVFRITRDADMGVDEGKDEDFVEAMEQVLQGREFSDVVRLSVSGCSDSLTDLLSRAVGVAPDEVFSFDSPLDLAAFMGIAGQEGFDELRDQPWPQWDSPVLPTDEPVWDVIKRQDVMLYHPFESFEPVVRLLAAAAVDPDVLAIKMTLYRTSGDSPIVRALEQAAGNGIQVTALVEIKARFDEQRNISWAERLERAGVIVVYGVAGLKVHAKALLIIRRQKHGIQRYVHLGTGNYNDRTASLYTDLGLLTCRADIAYEVGLFFNAVTGYSAIPSLAKIHMAPVGLKAKLLQLIERETHRAADGVPTRILAKMNSLADPEIIQALYDASRAGVEIKLNVRGISMLVPGVPSQSETITVVSIVDRYLEHARLYYFHNGGSPEVYAGSADWMPRNLERRVELMFPVEDSDAVERVRSILELAFSDNRNAHVLQSDGTYLPMETGEDPVCRSQEELSKMAKQAAKLPSSEARTEFVVRRKPPAT